MLESHYFINIQGSLLVASTNEDHRMLTIELEWSCFASNQPLLTTIHTFFDLKHLSIVISVAFNNVLLITPIRQGFTVHGCHLWSLMFVCALWALKQQSSSLLVSTCKNTHVATCTMPYFVILFLRVSSCEGCVRSTFKVHKFLLWTLDSDCECWWVYMHHEQWLWMLRRNKTSCKSQWVHNSIVVKLKKIAFPNMCFLKRLNPWHCKLQPLSLLCTNAMDVHWFNQTLYSLELCFAAFWLCFVVQSVQVKFMFTFEWTIWGLQLC
jgi:hypothetical protein